MCFNIFLYAYAIFEDFERLIDVVESKYLLLDYRQTEGVSIEGLLCDTFFMTFYAWGLGFCCTGEEVKGFCSSIVIASLWRYSRLWYTDRALVGLLLCEFV